MFNSDTLSNVYDEPNISDNTQEITYDSDLEFQDDIIEYGPSSSSNATTHVPSITTNKKHKKTALSSVVDEIHANAKNDKKFLELMSGLVKTKTTKDVNKPLLATEIIIQGLTKLILTFPVRDQLDMTNRISHMVHERALEIEIQQNST